MKKILAIIFFLCLMIQVRVEAAPGTPFYFNFLNDDGSPNTNYALMQAWPPNNNYTMYGTNVVYGGQIITLMPNASGYGTNIAFANFYRVLFTNMTPNLGFFVALPDYTNVAGVNLANCLTNVPVINASGNNAWGGLRGAASDTALEFLEAGISNAGLIVFLTNTYTTAGGVSTFVIVSNYPSIAVTTSNETWSGGATNTFQGTVIATNLLNSFAGSNVVATNLIGNATLSTNAINATNVSGGTVAGNGNGLTNLNATNLVALIQPTNWVWASFVTNGLVTNCPTITLLSNLTGTWLNGTVYCIPTYTAAVSNTLTFSVFTTNEEGPWTNFTTLSTNAVGPLNIPHFNVTMSNNSGLTFNTTCTSNATYKLRVAFAPWLDQ